MRLGRLSGILGPCAGLLVLSACASHPPSIGGATNLQVLPGHDLPVPTRKDVSLNAGTYYVGPFDRLTIDVFGIDELSQREVQVDAAGRLSFPLAGVIEVGGMTPGDVELELARRLTSAHVRNPQVTVNLKETLSRVVTVEGQVKKPGLYPVIGQMTLMRAVARAEGTDEFSKLNDVVVFRTVDGQRFAALYDFGAIRHGAYLDPEIYAGDVVMVGESKSRRLFKDIIGSAPAFLSPLVIALDRFSK